MAAYKASFKGQPSCDKKYNITVDKPPTLLQLYICNILSWKIFNYFQHSKTNRV